MLDQMNMQVSSLGNKPFPVFSRPIVHVQEVNTGYECRPNAQAVRENSQNFGLLQIWGETDHALLAGAQL